MEWDKETDKAPKEISDFDNFELLQVNFYKKLSNKFYYFLIINEEKLLNYLGF